MLLLVEEVSHLRDRLPELTLKLVPLIRSVGWIPFRKAHWRGRLQAGNGSALLLFIELDRRI